MKSTLSTRRAFLKTTAAFPWFVAAGAGTVSVGKARAQSPLSPANPTIQAARSVALSTLKPSVKDLAHGMELHTQSVVFESYGFSPRTAIDGDAFDQEIRAGASE